MEERLNCHTWKEENTRKNLEETFQLLKAGIVLRCSQKYWQQSEKKPKNIISN
jgi:hypothetical protein